MWTCDICKYTTKYSTHFKSHLETGIHIEKSDKHEKKQQKKLEKERLKKEEEESEKDKKIYKKLTNIENQQLSIKNQQLITDKKVDKISKNVKEIKGYVKFLNTHCTDAEPITELTDGDVIELLHIDDYKPHKFEQNIIEYMEDETLHIKLGDLLLEKYLNPENLAEQPVWVSDVARKIYLIFLTIKKKNNWVRDAEGIQFIKLVIVPIIKKLQELMKIHHAYIMKNFDDDHKPGNRNTDILATCQYATTIQTKSYCDKLKKNVLKYVTGKFSIAGKKDEILEEAD